MKKYAVVITFSFSPQVSVMLFDTWDEGMNFIKKDILEEHNYDIENEFDSEYVIHDEDGTATLTAHFGDGDDVTEWKIGEVFNLEDM